MNQLKPAFEEIYPNTMGRRDTLIRVGLSRVTEIVNP